MSPANINRINKGGRAMSFGRAFKTRKEANAYAKKINAKPDVTICKVQVRKLNKKLFPRRKNLFHVGTELDFLNFA